MDQGRWEVCHQALWPRVGPNGREKGAGSHKLSSVLSSHLGVLTQVHTLTVFLKWASILQNNRKVQLTHSSVLSHGFRYDLSWPHLPFLRTSFSLLWHKSQRSILIWNFVILLVLVSLVVRTNLVLHIVGKCFTTALLGPLFNFCFERRSRLALTLL